MKTQGEKKTTVTLPTQGMSIETQQIERTILNGKKTLLHGNSAKTLIRFELEEGTHRRVVIAEDREWRKRNRCTGNPILHYKIVTHYTMNTSCEPRKWVNLNGDSNEIRKS